LSFTDVQIISILKKQPKKEGVVLKYLYEKLDEPIRKFILSNSGKNEDVDDVIQDAIIIFYEKVKSNEYQLKSNVIGYVYTIGKYIWYNRQRKTNKYLAPLKDDNFNELSVDPIDFDLFEIESTKLVEGLLNNIGENCRKILIQSFYLKIPMKEIAKLHKLKNEQIARNKKHKCLKKLREIIEKSAYLKSLAQYINYEDIR